MPVMTHSQFVNSEATTIKTSPKKPTHNHLDFFTFSKKQSYNKTKIKKETLCNLKLTI
jgi:hypothetical protein